MPRNNMRIKKDLISVQSLWLMFLPFESSYNGQSGAWKMLPDFPHKPNKANLLHKVFWLLFLLIIGIKLIQVTSSKNNNTWLNVPNLSREA